MKYTQMTSETCLGDRFVIDTLMGRGSSSAVYRAKDATTGAVVALKVLDPILISDPVAVARFKHDLAILKDLSHPSIVQVFECVTVDDYLVIAMELVEGVDLKKHLSTVGVIAGQEFFDLAFSILNALGACHRANVIHRDLKPQNILVAANLDIKLMDFGISRLNSMPGYALTGAFTGTAQYIAPEQLAGKYVDATCDIYSIGATFYEILEGKPFMTSSNLSDVIRHHVQSDFRDAMPKRQDFPKAILPLLAKCLAANPSDRYQSCAEIVHDLKKVQAAPTVVAPRLFAVGLMPQCHSCRESALPDLGFCYACGEMVRPNLNPGDRVVMVSRYKNREAFFARLHAIYGHGSAIIREWRDFDPPHVVFSGLSESSAVAQRGLIGQDLAEVVIPDAAWTQHLGRGVTWACAIAVLAVVALGTNRSLPLATLASAFVVALTVVYCRRCARPMVNLVGDRVQQALPPLQTYMHPRFAALTRTRVKYLLGRIVGHCQEILDRHERARIPINMDLLKRCMDYAASMTRALNQQEEYVSDRNARGIEDKIRGLEIRARHAAPQDIETLMKTRAGLVSELALLQDVENQRHRSQLKLLNLKRILFEMETAADASQCDAMVELAAVCIPFAGEEPSTAA